MIGLINYRSKCINAKSSLRYSLCQERHNCTYDVIPLNPSVVKRYKTCTIELIELHRPGIYNI